MTSAAVPRIPRSISPRKAVSTTSASAIRCPTRSPGCSAGARSSTPSWSRPRTSPGANTLEPRPSTEMPLASTPRTRGRSHLAWCSITVCATSCTRPSPSARKGLQALHFPRRPPGLRNSSSINPQPGYRFNLNGLGPRVQLDWLAGHEVHVRAGGAITTIPPNLYQDNSLTGSTPFAVYPRLTSAPTGPIPYGFQITSDELPRVYTPEGQDIFANGTKAVHANTVMDFNRYQQDLAALSPSHRITPLNINCYRSRLRQRISSDLDSRPGAPFRRPGRRRDLHRHRGSQAPPGELFQRLSRRGSALCSVHSVRLRRQHHRRLRHRERRHQHGPLLVPRVADLAAGNCPPRRPGRPGQLYVVQVAR